MPTGFHHIALVCKDMKEQIRFYEQAMGMKLRAIYPQVPLPLYFCRLLVA